MTFTLNGNNIKLDLPKKVTQKGVTNMLKINGEMKMHGVKNVDICRVIRKTEKTVRNKLNGTTDFSVVEAISIRNALFPGRSLEELFSEGDDKKAG